MAHEGGRFVTAFWRRRAPIALVACLAAIPLLLLAPQSWPQGAEPTPPAPTINDYLIYDGPNTGEIPPPDCIEIAPMVKKGSAEAGSWTTVGESIWDSILARTGIIPGQTRPATLSPREGYAGAPGFIENIAQSMVLNADVYDETTKEPVQTSRRMSFGYFVRIRQTIGGKPVMREFFLLMSYDLIDQGKPDGNPAAFEVFVFQMPVPGTVGVGDPNALINLQNGLAVTGPGQLLGSVPTNIALANNYKEDEVPPNTPVTIGTDPEEPGKGCFMCHANRTKTTPNSTGPFPWRATDAVYRSSLSSHLAHGGVNCPPPTSAAVLQGGVLQGNVLQGGVLGGDGGNSIGVIAPTPNRPNRTGDSGAPPPGEPGHPANQPGHPSAPPGQPSKAGDQP